MSTRWVSISLLTLLISCASNRPDNRNVPDAKSQRRPAPSTTSSTQQSFTGTLRGGVIAIGGETTGWRLEGDGSTGGIDLDFSTSRARLERLDGRRVTVTGCMKEVDWPERGPTQVLVVDSIDEATEEKSR